MTEKCFVDTNIFVYSRDSINKDKCEKSVDLIVKLKKENLIAISTQVVTEFISVMNKKYNASLVNLKKDIELLLELDPIEINENIINQGIKLYEQYLISWWDAWIVSAAIVGGCKKIYSEDLNHGASYHGVLVVNPFFR